MANLPMEEIEKMIGSRYALTVLAGKRARDLRDGAPRLVNTSANNPIIIALQEIYAGKVVPEGEAGEPKIVEAEETETSEVDLVPEAEVAEIAETVPELVEKPETPAAEPGPVVEEVSEPETPVADETATETAADEEIISGE